MIVRALRLLYADPFRTLYDDPPANDDTVEDDDDTEADAARLAEVEAARLAEAAAVAAAKAKAPASKQKLKVALTQEQQEFVNSLVAEERRKAKAISDRAITQLETEKNKAGTTQAEKEALEVRIEDLKASQLTAEELRKKEEKKKETKWANELTARDKEIDKWRELYTGSTVRRAITDAAVEHRAHNPRHIVKELVADTRLIDELDEDGKPTGELIPRTRMRTTKDGKPVVLDMTVTEAVKLMSEQEEHAPLFHSGASGGLGARPNSAGGKGSSNPDEPPTDPALYQAWRAKRKAAGVKN